VKHQLGRQLTHNVLQFRKRPMTAAEARENLDRITDEIDAAIRMVEACCAAETDWRPERPQPCDTEPS